MYRMPIKTNNYLNIYFCLLPDQRQHCWLFARKHHQHIPAKRGPTVQRKPDLNRPPGLSSTFCGPRGTKRRMLPLAGGVQRDTVCPRALEYTSHHGLCLQPRALLSPVPGAPPTSESPVLDQLSLKPFSIGARTPSPFSLRARTAVQGELSSTFDCQPMHRPCTGERAVYALLVHPKVSWCEGGQ